MKLTTREIILCGLFAALVSIFAQISIPLPFTTVPLTLQIFGIAITGLILGSKCAFISILIYLILGFFAINYSIYLYKYLFKNASINLSLLMKKYLKVLVLSLILLIISSVIEVFLIPNVLKLFTKTLF